MALRFASCFILSWQPQLFAALKTNAYVFFQHPGHPGTVAVATVHFRRCRHKLAGWNNRARDAGDEP